MREHRELGIMGVGHREVRIMGGDTGRIMADITDQSRRRTKATRRGTERSEVEPGLVAKFCCSGD